MENVESCVVCVRSLRKRCGWVGEVGLRLGKGVVRGGVKLDNLNLLGYDTVVPDPVIGWFPRSGIAAIGTRIQTC